MVRYLETKGDFDAALKDAGSKLVVVDFTASWCGPCQMIAPKFQAMSEEYTDVLFYKVDVDKNAETAEHERISAMPTFIFYKNGKRVEEFCGANEAKLKAKIQANK